MPIQGDEPIAQPGLQAAFWPGLLLTAMIALLLFAVLADSSPADRCDPLAESAITGQRQCPPSGQLWSL